MIAPFSLVLPKYLRFGRGLLTDALDDIAGLGPRILVVHGANPLRAAGVIEGLKQRACGVQTLAIGQEPTLGALQQGLGQVGPVDVVVGIGGGSVIDFAKALSALLPIPNVDPLDHLEVVGRGLPLPLAPLPYVAIPTTAGTGAEVTKNAVILVEDHRQKVSLRDDRMVPQLVVVDPALTDGTPQDQTLASGLDAITQVVEPFVSRKSNPVTDALCFPMIGRGLAALTKLMQSECPDARDDMCLTSVISGIALANAGLGAVHGFAGVLGGETGQAHGKICGRLLPYVMAVNHVECRDNPIFSNKFNRIEDIFCEHLGFGFSGLAEWISSHGLVADHPPLTAQKRSEIATAAQSASSMRGNPIELGHATLVQILERAGW